MDRRWKMGSRGQGGWGRTAVAEESTKKQRDRVWGGLAVAQYNHHNPKL